MDDPNRCYVCTERERAQNAFIDEKTNAPGALRFNVSYRDD